MVDDRQLREVPDLPPRLVDSEAVVGLFAVEEEALVHVSDAFDHLPADEHERARGPVAQHFVLVTGRVELALPQP